MFRTPYSRTECIASAWGMMLGRKEALMDKTSREVLKFRRRFRVPFPFFKELVKEVESQGWLSAEMADSSGRSEIPLQLKVLAVLQIIGRGNVLTIFSNFRACPRGELRVRFTTSASVCA
ncbi:unnamed protein product [Discosporangium mesarthrocarpum]